MTQRQNNDFQNESRGTFIPRKHRVFFQVEKLLRCGEAIYIRGSIPELGSNDDLQAIRLENLDERFWIGDIYIDAYQPGEDTVTYEYFVASFDNPRYKNQDQKHIERQFNLSELQEHYIRIFDEWNVIGEFPSRKKIYNPKDMIFLNFELPRHVDYGEAVYFMGPLEDLGEPSLLKAVRMQWGANDRWKGTVDIEFSRVFALKGKMTFMFFKSYYYKRYNLHWVLVGESGRTLKTFENEETLRLWQENHPEVPIFLDVDDEGIIEEIDPSKPPVMLNFVYEHPTTKNSDRILEVNVISKAFGKVKMDKEVDGKWRKEIWVAANKIKQGKLIYDFFYEVHYLDKEIEITQEISKEEEVLPGEVIECNVKRRNHDSSFEISFFKTNSGINNIQKTKFLGTFNNNFGPWLKTGTSNGSSRAFSNCLWTINSGAGASGRHIYNGSTRYIGNGVNNLVIPNHFVERVTETMNNLQGVQKGMSSLVSCTTNFVSNFRHISKTELPYISSVRKHMKTAELKSNARKLQFKLKSVSKLEVIEDDCKKIIEDLIKEAPRIKQMLDELEELNKTQESTMTHLEEDTFQLLRIKLITLAKKWGYQQKFGDDFGKEIVKTIAEYFPLETFPAKDLIFCLLEVNKYCNEIAQYTLKVQHSGCQGLMQNAVKRDFDKYLQDPEKSPQIQNHPFYELVLKLITKDLDSFIDFAKQHGLNMQWKNTCEQPLFKMLINYSLLYSVSRSFDPSINRFTTCGCGELGPFCNESDKTTISHLNLSELEKKYLAEKGQLQKQTEKMEEKIIQKETSLVKLCEETTGKEVLAMVQVKLDLQLLQKKMQEGVDGISLDIIIDQVAESAEDLDNQVQEIDKINNFEEKIAKVRELKSHKSLEVIEKFYNSMIDS